MTKFKFGQPKKIISILITLLIVCSLVPITAGAAAAVPVASLMGDSFSNLYYSIEAAWNDARVNPGCTLSLLKDVTAVSNLELNFDNLNFTVDLDGKTLNLADNSIIVNLGKLTITDSSSGGTGKVTGSATPLSVDGGELTILGGLFACTNGNNSSILLRTTSGTVNIEDGLFTDRIYFEGTNVNINGGDFLKKVDYNCSDMTLIINDGNFSAGASVYNGTAYINDGCFNFLTAYSVKLIEIRGGSFRGLGSYGAGYLSRWLATGYAYYDSNGTKVDFTTESLVNDCNVTVAPA